MSTELSEKSEGVFGESVGKNSENSESKKKIENNEKIDVAFGKLV